MSDAEVRLMTTHYLFALENHHVRIIDFEPTIDDVEKSAVIMRYAVQKVVDSAGDNLIHMNAFEFFMAFANSLSCAILHGISEAMRE